LPAKQTETGRLFLWSFRILLVVALVEAQVLQRFVGCGVFVPELHFKEGEMPKVVDVILRGQLKASYPVSFAMLNSPITEQDFIGYAKEAMRDDKYSEADIKAAQFRVRDMS
jgi:hypothetical protein